MMIHGEQNEILVLADGKSKLLNLGYLLLILIDVYRRNIHRLSI